MRKCVVVPLLAIVILSLAALLNAQSLTPSPTGSWTPTVGAMSQARTGTAAAAMSDGTVLVTGGTDAGGNVLATAEIYASADTFKTVAPMKNARTGHTATWLQTRSRNCLGMNQGW